jgi:pyruvate formate lyase activating enzyme
MGQLYDITPFTLLDYPGETACIVWLSGCSLRCVYCHNPEIVLGTGEMDKTELMDFLQRRRGLLTGVVFSGGEPTLSPYLPELAQEAKKIGFKIKLDTNGTKPDVLERLLDNHLLDDVALDYKCLPNRAQALLGTAAYVKPFKEGLKMLIGYAREGSGLEIRTTFHPDLMTEEEVNSIINDLDRLKYRGIYYIQNISSYGAHTLGNISRPSRSIAPEKLVKPKNFKVEFRNYPASH